MIIEIKGDIFPTRKWRDIQKKRIRKIRRKIAADEIVPEGTEKKELNCFGSLSRMDEEWPENEIHLKSSRETQTYFPYLLPTPFLTCCTILPM